jgi:hypothetical protein
MATHRLQKTKYDSSRKKSFFSKSNALAIFGMEPPRAQVEAESDLLIRACEKIESPPTG